MGDPNQRRGGRSNQDPGDGEIAASGETADAAILRALLEVLPIQAWVKGPEGAYLAGNTRFAATTLAGTPEGIVGRVDPDLFEGDIGVPLAAHDAEIRASREPRTFIEEIVVTGNDIRQVEVHKAPVTVDGRVIATVGCADDVTDLQHLRIEGHASRHEHVLMLESLPITIIRYDTDCRRTFVNSHFARAYPGDASELLGTSPRELWTEGIFTTTADEFQRHIETALQTGEPQTFEMEAINPPLLELIRALPERDAAGRVTGVLMVGVDISDLAEYRSKIAHLAFHDHLTNLPNRAMFTGRMEAAAALAARNDTMFAVLMLDVDRFKTVNDTMGHAAGDVLLTLVADRLRASVRPYDLVARLGGDEFAVLMEDIASPTDLRRLADRLLATFATPFVVEDREVSVTTSIGVATHPHDGREVEDLLRGADSAMYEAKRLGRDNVQFFSHELSRSLSERLAVERELGRALDRGELSLAFQPIVMLRDDRRIAAAEALLRWNNPSLGFVSPAVFIPIAEETGLIAPIGRWVFEEVCRAAAQINGVRERPIYIASNVSARQFVRTDLAVEIAGTIERTGCDPRWLKIEITESVLMDDDVDTRATLRAMSEMGIRIAIDDFGTGFSSLSYLAAFPSDVVKIDRSFVNEITTDEPTQHVVRAVIGMATNLQKELVAEGIETAEQATLLTEWGCHRGQGYHFARPMPFDQLLTAIADDDTRHT